MRRPVKLLPAGHVTRPGLTSGLGQRSPLSGVGVTDNTATSWPLCSQRQFTPFLSRCKRSTIRMFVTGTEKCHVPPLLTFAHLWLGRAGAWPSTPRWDRKYSAAGTEASRSPRGPSDRQACCQCSVEQTLSLSCSWSVPRPSSPAPELGLRPARQLRADPGAAWGCRLEDICTCLLPTLGQGGAFRVLLWGGC